MATNEKASLLRSNLRVMNYGGTLDQNKPEECEMNGKIGDTAGESDTAGASLRIPNAIWEESFSTATPLTISNLTLR
jgi:hypothetical protein